MKKYIVEYKKRDGGINLITVIASNEQEAIIIAKQGYAGINHKILRLSD